MYCFLVGIIGMAQVTKPGCYCDNSGISLVLSSCIAQRWPFAGPGLSI